MSDEGITIDVYPGDVVILDKAAQTCGLSIEDFVLKAALGRAQRVLCGEES